MQPPSAHAPCPEPAAPWACRSPHPPGPRHAHPGSASSSVRARALYAREPAYANGAAVLERGDVAREASLAAGFVVEGAEAAGPVPGEGARQGGSRPHRRRARRVELGPSGHAFDGIPAALEDLAQGRPVVVVDDEDRENEGDLIMAADRATPEAVAFFVEHTSGVICVGMEGARLDALQLPLMVDSAENEEVMYTAFTVTVDARHGISTGISAADRARTLRLLADPATSAGDLRRPGHIFPLRSRPGGVLARPGHTEAGVDLTRLAGCYPAGVLCELVDRSDGSMAKTPLLMDFAAQHDLRIVTIADLIQYRRLMEQP